MKRMYVGALLLVIAIIACTVSLAQVTPAHQAAVGVWDTDKGGQMEFYIQDGKLYAKVVATEKGIDPNAKCTRCSGDLKDKPLMGAVLIYSFTPDSDGTWSGGRIADSKTGLIYQGKIKVEAATMTLRAYLGNPILGGSLVWKRH